MTLEELEAWIGRIKGPQGLFHWTLASLNYPILENSHDGAF